MKQKNNSGGGQASVSFLDVIACAFCAIVILVLILPIGQNAVTEVEEIDTAPTGRLLFLIDATKAEIQSLQAQLASNKELLSSIESESSSIVDAAQQISMAVNKANSEISTVEAQSNALARTKTILTTVRPSGPDKEQVRTELAGIPVDSEYLCFVVDTSGSMQIVWDLVTKELERFWLLYPELKGFQIMNDNGNYLYRHTRGTWIPDSESARKRALARSGMWMGFSDSSPIDGIEKAITDLYKGDIKMAIVVVGDDYSGNWYRGFFDKIDSLVTTRSSQGGELRIHSLGMWNGGVAGNAAQYSSLMRELTNRYDGAFVALESFDPLGIDGLMSELEKLNPFGGSN